MPTFCPQQHPGCFLSAWLRATDQSTVLAILAITTLAAGKATEFAGVVSSSATTVTSLEVDL